MRVGITGGNGFIGSRLADLLLKDETELGRVTSLLLVDIVAPEGRKDPRVICKAMDISESGAPEKLVSGLDVLFHLAAVVSGHAEADFDLGFRVNLDATRALLEAARHNKPALRFVFSSTVGVFGGNLPEVISESTAVTPENSYGAAKAASELLVNDYSRRGFVDGRVVRLPTVTVRGGEANRAVTSFASGVARSPLAGRKCRIPVSRERRLWITSPRAVLTNIVHAAAIPKSSLPKPPLMHLPGICVSVAEMTASVEKVAGKEVASRIYDDRDELIDRMVASFPAQFDNTRSLQLGFVVDTSFDDIVREYIRDDLKGKYVK